MKESKVPYIVIVSVVAVVAIVILVMQSGVLLSEKLPAGQALSIGSTPPTTGASLCPAGSVYGSSCGLVAGYACLINTTNSAGALYVVCVPRASELQPCSIAGYYSSGGSECATGLLCVREPSSNGPKCHKICEYNIQCADATCRLPWYGGSTKVC